MERLRGWGPVIALGSGIAGAAIWMATGFGRVNEEIESVRTEIQTVRTEIQQVRTEIQQAVAPLNARMSAMEAKLDILISGLDIQVARGGQPRRDGGVTE